MSRRGDLLPGQGRSGRQRDQALPQHLSPPKLEVPREALPYDGWIQVGTMAGEMRDPSRDLPRAIILGLSVVAVAYLAVNWSILGVLPAAQVAQLGDKAAVVASEKMFGASGGTPTASADTSPRRLWVPGVLCFWIWVG